MSEADKPAEISMLGRVHQPNLPPELDEVFKPLRNEISFLHGNWEVYRELYVGPESEKVFEITAGTFVVIQLVLRHEIIMGFSRITDPKNTGKKENLTLLQLLHVVEKHCTDKELMYKLKADEGVIRNECEPFRTIRNRSLAHLDLQTFLGSHPEPLPTMDGALVVKCLELLSTFMNDILGHFTTVYFDFVPHLGHTPRNIVHVYEKFMEWRPIIYEMQRKALLGDEA